MMPKVNLPFKSGPLQYPFPIFPAYLHILPHYGLLDHLQICIVPAQLDHPIHFLSKIAQHFGQPPLSLDRGVVKEPILDILSKLVLMLF